LLGQFAFFDAKFLGPGDDLIVHVGVVADEGDLITERNKEAAQHVKNDRGPEVSDMRGTVDGRSADIDRDFPRDDRLKFLKLVP
jgi:hypothetical protein